MIDYIEIEGCPSEEDCVQVEKTGAYVEPMKAEVRRFMHMLYERFINFPVRFKMSTNEHDFGVYYDVKIIFDDSNEDAVYFIEEHLPTTWDDKTKYNWTDIINGKPQPEMEIT